MTARLAPTPTAQTPPGLSFFRDADWLTPDRAGIFARLWLVAGCLAALVWVLLARNGVDLLGKPVGTDFASFWTASQLALGGHPAKVYDLAVHRAAQTRLFGRDVGDYAFFYPPVFLLFCLPLAAAPYLASLGAWLAATGAAYAGVVGNYLPERRGLWIGVLAFPAVLVNAGHGQNGFLTAALFGGGLLLLDRRPVIAGALLGCLIYKPHLGLVIPIALLASGRWRAIAGAAASVSALVLASIQVFGLETWRAFLAASPFARMALERNMVGNEKMQSVFAAVRLLHGGLGLAYGVQALVAVCVCGALVRFQRKAPRAPAEGPALVIATLLASPFLLDYDLILLAIPLAWLTARAVESGFRPWEKIIFAAGFIAPAVSRNIAGATGVPIGPVVVGALFWLVLRRWREPSALIVADSVSEPAPRNVAGVPSGPGRLAAIP